MGVFYASDSRYYQDGTTHAYTSLYAGYAGTTVYYTMEIYDLSSLADKTITSIKYYVRTIEDGNSTTLPAGCGASKTWSYAECQSVCQNPTATANITQGAGVTWTFDLTPDIDKFRDTTRTLVYMGPRDSTASTYKVFGSATNATVAHRPYLEVTTADGVVYYYTGTAWVPCTVHYYDGTAWQQCIPYYYDGSAWKECGQ